MSIQIKYNFLANIYICFLKKTFLFCSKTGKCMSSINSTFSLSKLHSSNSELVFASLKKSAINTIMRRINTIFYIIFSLLEQKTFLKNIE